LYNRGGGRKLRLFVGNNWTLLQKKRIKGMRRSSGGVLGAFRVFERAALAKAGENSPKFVDAVNGKAKSGPGGERPNFPTDRPDTYIKEGIV